MQRQPDATARTINEISATPVTPYVSNPSAVGPTLSPALSPVQSAITPGLRGSSSLMPKYDFHQVGTDIGDLGEDAAGDTQGAGAEGFTDGKADEACSGQFPGNKQQDDQHHDQLDAD